MKQLLIGAIALMIIAALVVGFGLGFWALGEYVIGHDVAIFAASFVFIIGLAVWLAYHLGGSVLEAWRSRD